MFDPLFDEPFDYGTLIRREAAKASESQYGNPGPFNQSRPNDDPRNQAANSKFSFQNTGRVIVGCITGVTVLTHTYRVQFEKAKYTRNAIYLPRTACSPSGPRELTTLPAGCMVLCLDLEHLPYTIILGPLPIVNTQVEFANAGVLFGSSRQRVDSLHKLPLRMDQAGGISDTLSGRPIDGLMAGEKGWITETGLRMLIDAWLITIGVSEDCALTLFRHDKLLRLAAYNYQHRTHSREEESLNDQDEVLDWRGTAGYPWEQLGRFSKVDPAVLSDAQTWQISQPWLGKLEPADPRAMPWHRHREFKGYLGQGEKRIVQTAPVTAQPTDYACYTGGNGLVGAKHPGLFDWAVLQDGRACMQSAKGISIAKRPLIVTPTRLRRPEQPGGLGDDDTNYQFSGLTGSGPTPTITGDFLINDSNTNMRRAAGLIDLHGYFFNYAGIHPFWWHKKDWIVPEESATDWTDGTAFGVPGFTELGTNQYLSAENFKKTLKVDHRYGNQDFCTLPCGLDLLDDGGVVLYGGMGESLTFAGGQITLSAPGDITLASGRDVLTWAGWDVILRAKNSIDGTATNNDVHFKAERNMQLVAGNGGEGGILLESRAEEEQYDFTSTGEGVTSSGIILKAKNSPIVAWGAGIYLRTGGGNVTSGNIYLDANQGIADIVTTSQNFTSFLVGGVCTQYFGTSDVSSANTFSEEGTSLIGELDVGGDAVIAGDVSLEGNVNVADGHIYTEQADEFQGLVQLLSGEGLNKAYAATAEADQEIYTATPAEGDAYWSGTVMPDYYADGKPGNDTVITQAEFSLRSMADYQSTDFTRYEDRWQQLARLDQQNMATWTENPVICQGVPTYPFPGRERFEARSLLQTDLRIFDMSNKHDMDRGTTTLADPYANPTLGAPTQVSLNNYIVIR